MKILFETIKNIKDILNLEAEDVINDFFLRQKIFVIIFSKFLFEIIEHSQHIFR